MTAFAPTWGKVVRRPAGAPHMCIASSTHPLVHIANALFPKQAYFDVKHTNELRVARIQWSCGPIVQQANDAILPRALLDRLETVQVHDWSFDPALTSEEYTGDVLSVAHDSAMGQYLLQELPKRLSTKTGGFLAKHPLAAPTADGHVVVSTLVARVLLFERWVVLYRAALQTTAAPQVSSRCVIT